MNKRSKKNNNWDEFCAWLVDDLKLGNLPIEWEVIRQVPHGAGLVDPLVGEEIVRIDIFKDKPYQVSVGIPNNVYYMTLEMSYYISRNTMRLIKDAIKTKSPRVFIPYSQFIEAV